MKNERKILLTDVNEFITCFLCRGYLIDATTIPDCLHTCKYSQKITRLNTFINLKF